jgi:hypothetical protein
MQSSAIDEDSGTTLMKFNVDLPLMAFASMA